MASVAPISQFRSLCNSLQLRAAAPKKLPPNFSSLTITNSSPNPTVFAGKLGSLSAAKKKMVVVVSATMAEKSKKRYPGESKGFVGEMRFLAKKLQTMRDQTKEGKKEPQGKPAAKRKPTIEGNLMFLVDSKLVYDTIEGIVAKAHFPEYAEFRNTGLERSESLAKIWNGSKNKVT